DHQAELRAHDRAGNIATAGPAHFAIYTVAPLINIAGVAEGDLLAHAVAPAISVTDLHPGTSDVRLNGQPYVSATPITASGDYRIDVSALDGAGNQSVSTLHFALDLDAPALT